MDLQPPEIIRNHIAIQMATYPEYKKTYDRLSAIIEAAKGSILVGAELNALHEAQSMFEAASDALTKEIYGMMVKLDDNVKAFGKAVGKLDGTNAAKKAEEKKNRAARKAEKMVAAEKKARELRAMQREAVQQTRVKKGEGVKKPNRPVRKGYFLTEEFLRAEEEALMTAEERAAMRPRAKRGNRRVVVEEKDRVVIDVSSEEEEEQDEELEGFDDDDEE